MGADCAYENWRLLEHVAAFNKYVQSTLTDSDELLLHEEKDVTEDLVIEKCASYCDATQECGYFVFDRISENCRFWSKDNTGLGPHWGSSDSCCDVFMKIMREEKLWRLRAKAGT